MNDRPDWVVRWLLVLIAVLLSINIYVSLTMQPGRYMRFGSDGVALLDTRTGKIYAARPGEHPPIGVIDMVEDSKSKK
jgi:hypothetical protein